MRSLRTLTADVLEEAARGRRASSRSSAALGKIIKHVGAAGLFDWLASRIRPEEDAEGDD